MLEAEIYDSGVATVGQSTVRRFLETLKQIGEEMGELGPQRSGGGALSGHYEADPDAIARTAANVTVFMVDGKAVEDEQTRRTAATSY